MMVRGVTSAVDALGRQLDRVDQAAARIARAGLSDQPDAPGASMVDAIVEIGNARIAFSAALKAEKTRQDMLDEVVRKL